MLCLTPTAIKLTSWQVSAIKDIRMNPDTGTREQTQDGRHIAKCLLQKAVLGIRNQLLILAERQRESYLLVLTYTI